MIVEVSKEISAPVDKVFKAWTDPNEMKKWFCRDGSEIRIQQDFRVGGQYKKEVTKGCDGKPVCVSGIYKEIVPEKKLVYTWNNDSEDHGAQNTLVTVEFIDKGKSTIVNIKHSNFITEKAFTRHNSGWQEVLNKVATAFSS